MTETKNLWHRRKEFYDLLWTNVMTLLYKQMKCILKCSYLENWPEHILKSGEVH